MTLANEFADNRAAFEVAAKQVLEAQSRLALLEAGNRPEQIEAVISQNSIEESA